MTENGLPLGFAVSAIEAIGREFDPAPARWALTRLRAKHGDWASIIDAAAGRLKGAGARRS